MNKSKAKTILTERLNRYREYSYEHLKQLIDIIEVDEFHGSSGIKYQLEFQIYWDNLPDHTIRVLGSIDDGGLRALFPLTQSFIKAPNGNSINDS